MTVFVSSGVGMTMSVDPATSMLRVAVSGEIDMATAEFFAATLERVQVLPVARVVVDLTGVKFLASVGARALRVMMEHVWLRGVSLQVVCSPSQAMTTVLRVHGVAGVTIGSGPDVVREPLGPVRVEPVVAG